MTRQARFGLAVEVRRALAARRGCVMPDNRLAQLRHATGLSQVAFARECGVTPSTIWRWEKNRVSIPDTQKVALAARFGVSVGVLMGWEPMEAAA